MDPYNQFNNQNDTSNASGLGSAPFTSPNQPSPAPGQPASGQPASGQPAPMQPVSNQPAPSQPSPRPVMPSRAPSPSMPPQPIFQPIQPVQSPDSNNNNKKIIVIIAIIAAIAVIGVVMWLSMGGANSFNSDNDDSSADNEMSIPSEEVIEAACDNQNGDLAISENGDSMIKFMTEGSKDVSYKNYVCSEDFEAIIANKDFTEIASNYIENTLIGADDSDDSEEIEDFFDGYDMNKPSTVAELLSITYSNNSGDDGYEVTLTPYVDEDNYYKGAFGKNDTNDLGFMVIYKNFIVVTGKGIESEDILNNLGINKSGDNNESENQSEDQSESQDEE